MNNRVQPSVYNAHDAGRIGLFSERPAALEVSGLRAHAKRHRADRGWYWQVVRAGGDRGTVWCGFGTPEQVASYMADLATLMESPAESAGIALVRRRPSGRRSRSPRFDAVMGTVYLIAEAETDWVKVGWTKRGLPQRLSVMQVGNPRDLLLLGEHEGTTLDERAVHDLLDARQVPSRGEWFKGRGAVLAAAGDYFDPARRAAVVREIWTVDGGRS